MCVQSAFCESVFACVRLHSHIHNSVPHFAERNCGPIYFYPHSRVHTTIPQKNRTCPILVCNCGQEKAFSMRVPAMCGPQNAERTLPVSVFCGSAKHTWMCEWSLRDALCFSVCKGCSVCVMDVKLSPPPSHSLSYPPPLCHSFPLLVTLITPSLLLFPLVTLFLAPLVSLCSLLSVPLVWCGRPFLSLSTPPSPSCVTLSLLSVPVE